MRIFEAFGLGICWEQLLIVTGVIRSSPIRSVYLKRFCWHV